MSEPITDEEILKIIRDREMGYCEEAQTYCEVAERAYKQGRADAFQEIAYSDSVIKEPFETLAYEKGAREFAEWLATKRGCSKEWTEWNIDHWQKGAEE